ncbi:DinB family protein [Radiobacillus deserti]|uniref:DinB family protein n=1 Tax=Radiobacillus deserti TaxID=2594883 RepID=A0A516KC48_9BACI|nr:DinB family protein [Radiobacillus deserti]QDP38978.1 DinB family protein [Radiobacillus deserti]
MNPIVQQALHQIKIAMDSSVKLVNMLTEEDLDVRPTKEKFSVGELAAHLAIICEADWYIANGVTAVEMDRFYKKVNPTTIQEIKQAFLHSYDVLEQGYLSFSEEVLQQQITSHWGVTYSRYEWLLEILAHVYHHRGQLHTTMVHILRKDPRIPLFE